MRLEPAGPNPRLRRGLIAAALLSLPLGGCFAYVPAQPDGLPQGSQVRARLAPPGDFRLADVTANNVVLVRGEMIRADGDSLLLSAAWLEAQSGFDYPAGGVTLRIPRSDLAQLERRRLAKGRTALVVGGAVAIAVGAGFGFSGQGGGGGGGGGPTPQ